MKFFLTVFILFITSLTMAQGDQYYDDGNTAYHDEKDIQKGVALWKKAAELGNKYAQYDLGNHYLQAYLDLHEDENYTANSEEYRKAIKWLNKAYINGEDEAEFYLLALIETVQGTPDSEGWHYLMDVDNGSRFYYNKKSIETVDDMLFVTVKYEYKSIKTDEYGDSYDTETRGYLIKCSSATAQRVFKRFFFRGENVDITRSKTAWTYAGSISTDLGELRARTCKDY